MKEAVVNAFARSIFARKRVREAVSGDIRKYADLIDHSASDAALALAATMGVDLRSVGWHDQETFDSGRKLFALEHVVPVSQLRDACLDARSEAEVAESLVRARVAWVCHEEDQALTDLGYRSDRPDPEAAYRAAGISLAGLTYESPAPSADP